MQLEAPATVRAGRPPRVSPEAAAAELLRRRRATDSLHEFAKQAWPSIEGGRAFSDGWHIEALCEHLEAVGRGQIKNLLINVPPRTMKSSLVAVCFPAWMWIDEPWTQFLFVTYAKELSMRDSVKCRRILDSPWYRTRWGNRFSLVSDSNTKHRFDNDATGYRIATSIDGIGTGEGGDCIICDDPNSARDRSDVMLDNAISWWDGVMPTRLNDRRTGRRIVVQQRLHERDLTGHILSKDRDNWVHLVLPMEFETARRSVTVVLPSTKGKKWRDPRKKDGDLLWPKHFGPVEVKSLKNELASEYEIAGQLQQRPAPAEGGIIKKAWFKWWKELEPPPVTFILQSWDTALSIQKKAAYSACTTWGVFKETDTQIPNIILLALWRGKVEYPELRKMMLYLAKDYRDDDPPALPKHLRMVKKPAKNLRFTPDVVLVEAKANGISLIQDVARSGITATRFDPTRFGDKLERVRKVTHLIEAGRVWVPARPPAYSNLRPYADLLVEQCGSFPNAESRDVVDTMTQALIRLSISGWVWHPSDQPPEEPFEPEQREAFY